MSKDTVERAFEEDGIVRGSKTAPWCVNCGKDPVRCQCKRPVISVDEAPVEREPESRRVAINDKLDVTKIRYGRGR